MGQYSVGQVARWTNRSHSTISSLLKTKKIAGEKDGTRWVINGEKADLINQVNSQMKHRPHKKNVKSPKETRKGNKMLDRLAVIIDVPPNKWKNVVRLINLPDETFKVIVSLLD